MSNSGFDYQQAANFPNKIMMVRTLTKKTMVKTRHAKEGGEKKTRIKFNINKKTVCYG
jgi:hypothetical protein